MDVGSFFINLKKIKGTLKIDLAKQVLEINIVFEETNRIIKVGKGFT